MILRSNRKYGFTIFANDLLQDRSLSMETIGIATRMISMPEDTPVTIASVMKICSVGSSRARAALHELREAGYVISHRRRLPNGKWQWDSILSDVQFSQEQRATGIERKTPRKSIATASGETICGFPANGFPANNCKVAKAKETQLTYFVSELPDEAESDLRAERAPALALPVPAKARKPVASQSSLFVPEPDDDEPPIDDRFGGFSVAPRNAPTPPVPPPPPSPSEGPVDGVAGRSGAKSTSGASKSTKAKKGRPGPSGEPHPNTQSILRAYVDMIGYTPTAMGETAAAAKRIAQRGYTPEQVVACYRDKKTQPRFRGSHLKLSVIADDLPAWLAESKSTSEPYVVDETTGLMSNGWYDSRQSISEKEYQASKAERDAANPYKGLSGKEALARMMADTAQRRGLNA